MRMTGMTPPIARVPEGVLGNKPAFIFSSAATGRAVHGSNHVKPGLRVGQEGLGPERIDVFKAETSRSLAAQRFMINSKLKWAMRALPPSPAAFQNAMKR